MRHHPTRARSALLLMVVVSLSGPLVGCGGGGEGGGGGISLTGRTFEAGAGGMYFSLTVDAAGRFTVVARDAPAIAVSGGQGTLGADGRFFTQTPDGSVQFSGTVASNGQSAACRVTRGATTRDATGTLVPPDRATDTVAGSYFGEAAAVSASLSVDPTGHGTLFATTGAVTGGGRVNVAADGTLSAPDGAMAGQLVRAGTTFRLKLTRLAGTTVAVDLAVARTTRARWTFLVFLNAANDLQEFGPLNVNQMEKIGSTGDVNLVVQWKQAHCATCGTPEWVGTRRYYITKDSDTGRVNSQLVQDMGPSIDMGDWRELRNFIVWTQQRYPADRYALVIWNHGAGWRNTRGDRRAPMPRSVSIDDSTRNEIQVWELPQALDVTPQMDMVIFDASLMQMLEVAYEIRNSSRIMVGSEESPPGEGYVYDRFLADLAANPALSPAAFGQSIVTRTLEAYGTSNNLTQSALDLSRIQAVANQVNAFAGTLSLNIDGSRAAMVDARNEAESYAYPENKDLWDYAARIRAGSPSRDLQSSAAAVQAAVEAAVIIERHGTINANSHGIAIYIPSPDAYLTSYANLAFARATVWDSWLQEQPRSK